MRIRKRGLRPLFLILDKTKLICFDCPNRTCSGASTAANALIGIDLKLAVTCRDSAYRALTLTGTAADAGITYTISHSITLLL